MLDDSLKVNLDSYVFKAGDSYYAELQGDVLRVDTLGYAGSSSTGPYRYPLVTAELISTESALCC